MNDVEIRYADANKSCTFISFYSVSQWLHQASKIAWVGGAYSFSPVNHSETGWPGASVSSCTRKRADSTFVLHWPVQKDMFDWLHVSGDLFAPGLGPLVIRFHTSFLLKEGCHAYLLHRSSAVFVFRRSSRANPISCACSSSSEMFRSWDVLKKRNEGRMIWWKKRWKAFHICRTRPVQKHAAIIRNP